MKSILNILFIIVLSFSILSCEDNTEKLNPDYLEGQQENIAAEEDEEIISIAIPKPEFPITAVIDGESINFLTANNSDKALNSDVGGTSVLLFNTSDNQDPSAARYTIGLIFNRDDLKLGENELSAEAITKVTLSDNTLMDTVFVIVKGTLTITQLDRIKGIAAGTFDVEFNINESGVASTEVTNVTNGTFRFTYDVL